MLPGNSILSGTMIINVNTIFQEFFAFYSVKLLTHLLDTTFDVYLPGALRSLNQNLYEYSALYLV